MIRPMRALAILLAGMSVLAQAPITATPLPPLPGTEPRVPTQPAAPQASPQPTAPQTATSQPPAAPQTDAAPQASTRQPVAGTWVPRGAAMLQVLDKVNARHTTLSVKAGETARFETLAIGVRGCVVRGPDQAPDAAAFVTVTDSMGAAPPFGGWIVQSAPAASMLQHPIYDIRVAGCAP